MNKERNTIIKYHGKQIVLFSDERNDYVNLTDMAKADRGRKSIKSWLKNKQTLEFLKVWEEKHNPNFNGAQMGTIKKVARDNTTTKEFKCKLSYCPCYVYENKAVNV